MSPAELLKRLLTFFFDIMSEAAIKSRKPLIHCLLQKDFGYNMIYTYRHTPQKSIASLPEIYTAQRNNEH